MSHPCLTFERATGCGLRVRSSVYNHTKERVLGSPGTLFPFFGSRFPHKMTNLKKGALIVIGLLGYQGLSEASMRCVLLLGTTERRLRPLAAPGVAVLG